MMNVRTFVRTVDMAKSIVDNDALTWEDKYELVFSDEISGVIHETGLAEDWYDPDMDYEDDVRAFVDAQVEKADRLRTIKEIES